MKYLFLFLLASGMLEARENSGLIGLWKLTIHWDLSRCISENRTAPVNSFLVFDSTWVRMITIEKNEGAKDEIKREFVGKWKMEKDSNLAIRRVWYSVDSGNESSSSTIDHNAFINYAIEYKKNTLIIYGENFAPTLGKICQYKSVYEKKESKMDSAITDRSYKKYLRK
jgi:hypothetical protein